MAEALVSIVLEQLVTITRQRTEEAIRLIGDAEQEVEKLKSNFLSLQAVLADAENRQVYENTVRDWLEKLRDISYDIEDVLDEWNTTIQKLKVKEAESASKPLKKVCFLIPYYLCCCRRFLLRYDIAVKIRNLDRKLDVIAMEKDRFNFRSNMKGSREQDRPVTTSALDLTEVHGRDEDKNKLVDLLLSQSSQEQAPRIICMLGMGGIGKTTLARLAFNDDKVKTHFEQKIWVCVSEPFDEMRVAKAILESLTNNSPNLVELETVLRNIRQHIEEKTFLLVLDDVWTGDNKDWDQLMRSFKYGSTESRILVTTRKESVAKTMRASTTIRLGTLPEENCWSLFTQLAFFGKTHEEYEILKETGKKILWKCKGLPMAIKTLGSLLQFKKKIEEWQSVLNSEIWELKEVERGIFPPLLLSYYDLPPMLKKCFSYCAIFPKDYEIKKDQLINLWMAQDFLRAEQNKDMELIGEEYFETLAMHSFFQDFKRDGDNNIYSFKMHYIVHDFAQFLTQNECLTIEVDGLRESELESFNRKARHSMIMTRRGGSIPSSIYTQKSSRSLVVKCRGGKRGIVLSKLFDELACLRTLDLRDQLICEIPMGIKKLIHLRYLNLSENRMLKELHEALCDLWNLQILDIRYCKSLQTLPQGIGKLINLRHLLNWGTSLTCMPKSVERLTCLRTLDEFVISDSSNVGKACSLQRLKNFSHLQNIGIKGLGNITDVGKVEGAELYNKKNLRDLDLNFNLSINGNHEVLLEVLQPPSNLETLWIENYSSSTMSPRWIMSLTTLRRLGLDSCINCEHLPPLGKLPSLEFLFIWEMKTLKGIDNEFLGLESNGTSLSSTVIAFPKLKHLSFQWMEEWEDWNYENTETVEDGKVMPCLHTLQIINCPKLKSLPNHLHNMPALKKDLHGCPLIGRTPEFSSSSPPDTDQDLSNP